MFALLNILNYYTGKFMSQGLLILISIVIYCYAMRQMHEEIMNNKTYMATIIILMVTDLVSIFMLFSEAKEEEEAKTKIAENVGDKKQQLKKKKTTGKTIPSTTPKKDKKPANKAENDIAVDEVPKKMDEPPKNAIGTFGNDEPSIHTYE